jgi:hypothetical protein
MIHAADRKFHQKDESFHVLNKIADAVNGRLEQKDTALGVCVGMLNAANGTAHLKQGMMVAKVRTMRRILASLIRDGCVSCLGASYGPIRPPKWGIFQVWSISDTTQSRVMQ